MCRTEKAERTFQGKAVLSSVLNHVDVWVIIITCTISLEKSDDFTKSFTWP